MKGTEMEKTTKIKIPKVDFSLSRRTDGKVENSAFLAINMTRQDELHSDVSSKLDTKKSSFFYITP